jgi:signal peptidase I
MQPTLVEGDYLVVEKLSPKLGGLHRGDIIVFDVPQEHRLLIKRLIALEGDKLEIKDGKVFVNGAESKVVDLKGVETLADNQEFGNMTIPKGYIYAMGDNRPRSNDSRVLGPIETKRITGRAIFRLFPFNRIGKP